MDECLSAARLNGLPLDGLPEGQCGQHVRLRYAQRGGAGGELRGLEQARALGQADGQRGVEAVACAGGVTGLYRQGGNQAGMPFLKRERAL